MDADTFHIFSNLFLKLYIFLMMPLGVCLVWFEYSSQKDEIQRKKALREQAKKEKEEREKKEQADIVENSPNWDVILENNVAEQEQNDTPVEKIETEESENEKLNFWWCLKKLLGIFVVLFFIEIVLFGATVFLLLKLWLAAVFSILFLAIFKPVFIFFIPLNELFGGGEKK